MSVVIRHACELLRVCQGEGTTLRGAVVQNLDGIRDGAVVLENDTIAWVGLTSELPSFPSDAVILDATGKTVLPGFIDSHTHLLFAGTREDEFEQRLRGLSY